MCLLVDLCAGSNIRINETVQSSPETFHASLLYHASLPMSAPVPALVRGFLDHPDVLRNDGKHELFH